MSTLEGKRRLNIRNRKVLIIKLTLVGITSAVALAHMSGYFVGAVKASNTVTTADVTIARVPNPPLTSDLVNLPGDLRAVTVPEPGNLGDFVSNPNMARAIGKALFWDMQVGSDGVQACVFLPLPSRSGSSFEEPVKLGNQAAAEPDLTYSTGPGPNYQLKSEDFPLTHLAIPGFRGGLNSATDSNDVVSSQGVHFLGDGPDPLGFQVGSVKTRQGRAAKHTVDDKRGIQSSPVLGWASRERLQWRQSHGRTRS